MSEELQKQTHELVTRIDERLAGHCERFEDHVELTDKRFAHLNHTVYGANSTPGLKSDVAVLKDQSDRRTWVRRALVTAALSLLVALVTYLATF